MPHQNFINGQWRDALDGATDAVLAPATERVNHATTLVTNAILERKGPPTALVTTAGFRDVLETRLEYRYNVYDQIGRAHV